MLQPGLYEQTVSRDLAEKIKDANVEDVAETRDVDKAEAAFVLSEYVGEVVRKAIGSVDGKADQRLKRQVDLANSIIESARAATKLQDAGAAGELEGAEVDEPARQLMSVEPRHLLSGADAPGRASVLRPETR